MKHYILSQQIKLASGEWKWIDLSNNSREEHLRTFAKYLKTVEPGAILGLRSVEEIELSLDEQEKP